MTTNGEDAARRAVAAMNVEAEVGKPPRFKATVTIEACLDNPIRPVRLMYEEEPGGVRDECSPSTVEELHGWLQQKLTRALWGVEGVKALRIFVFGKQTRNHGD